MTAVAGIDPSITATGFADVHGVLHTVRSKETGDSRLLGIAAMIHVHCVGLADLVVLEDLPTHAHGAGITGMVQGVIRHALLDNGVPYATVAPATLKKYATGKGNATKADMRMALYKRTGLDVADDNQVDAWWLRAMGLDAILEAIVDLPAAQRAMLTKVDWP